MALFGLVSAFITACVADLFGDERTRPFTRGAFVLLLLEVGGLGLAELLRRVGAAALSIPI